MSSIDSAQSGQVTVVVAVSAPASSGTSAPSNAVPYSNDGVQAGAPSACPKDIGSSAQGLNGQQNSSQQLLNLIDGLCGVEGDAVKAGDDKLAGAVNKDLSQALSQLKQEMNSGLDQNGNSGNTCNNPADGYSNPIDNYDNAYNNAANGYNNPIDNYNNAYNNAANGDNNTNGSYQPYNGNDYNDNADNGAGYNPTGSNGFGLEQPPNNSVDGSRGQMRQAMHIIDGMLDHDNDQQLGDLSDKKIKELADMLPNLPPKMRHKVEELLIQALEDKLDKHPEDASKIKKLAEHIAHESGDDKGRFKDLIDEAKNVDSSQGNNQRSPMEAIIAIIAESGQTS